MANGTNHPEQNRSINNWPKLQWYLLYSALPTLVLFGVEGTIVWALSGFFAWLTNRHKHDDERNYTVAIVVWLIFAALLAHGRSLQGQ